MPISYQKAYYFLHRHIEGYDMPRAIDKWNRGYPDDPTTPQEIEEFLVDLVNRLEGGTGEYAAIYGIASGQELIHQSETGPPLGAPVKAKVGKPAKKTPVKKGKK